MNAVRCYLALELLEFGIAYGMLAQALASFEQSVGRITRCLARDLGRGLIIAGPKSDSNERDGGKEVSGQLVKAGCCVSEVLKLAKVAFDQIALAIDAAIHRPMDQTLTG